jgi:PAS domain S-box-containing protein
MLVRAALIGGSLLVYLVLFLLTYRETGGTTAALGLAPVALSGWLLGRWGGLLAGVLIVPVNMLLLYLAGSPTWADLGDRWPGIVIEIALGLGVGWVSELVERVKTYAGALAQERTALAGQIAERKRLEEALRASEQRLRMIIDTEPECVKIMAADGLILEMNRAGLAMLGADRPEEVIGHSAFEFIAPEYVDACRAMSARILAGAPAALEYEFIDLKGVRRWVETHGVPLWDETTSAWCQLSIARDITERRRLEAQLRQAQKMEAIGQLAGGVAHDFNNLLTVIQGYCHLLLMNSTPESPLRADLNAIKAAADQASTLVRQLLVFSRQEALQPRTLDLNQVVTDIQKMLGRLIGEHITLTLDLSPRIGHVKTDPGQMEQVLINLAVNARDAMPQGGALRIETANVKIDDDYVRLHGGSQAGSYVMLAVSDTGCGMDKATQSRIFEPFFTTKERGKGTGLGLATVYGIVKQSGGYIEVESEVDQGTTFKIYLPRWTDAADVEAVEPVEAALPGGHETILLVEDEEAVRIITRVMLEQQGYTVLEAVHGPDALEQAARYQDMIHLVITDVIMPEMNGRVLVEHLQRRYPHLKALYVSGYTDEVLSQSGGLDPEAVLLRKPFTSQALADATRQALGAY